ncbi:MAG: hypothetical protein HC767_00950 [Akkermansiaceae bacterium]|nr:hypothetical protein [Akkermansiaceae bacterium]
MSTEHKRDEDAPSSEPRLWFKPFKLQFKQQCQARANHQLSKLTAETQLNLPRDRVIGCLCDSGLSL